MNGRWRKKSIHHSNSEWMKLIYEIFTMIARCEIVGVSGITITAKQLMFCHRSEEIKGRKIQTYVLCVTTLTLNEFNVWPKQRIVQCLIIHQANPIRFLRECFRFRRWTNKLARKRKKVLYFKPDLKLHWPWTTERVEIHTCMWCIGPISKTNIFFYIFPFPSMILYKHVHWNKKYNIISWQR